MKPPTLLKTLITAAIFAGVCSAQATSPAGAPRAGLLGTGYVSASYVSYDISDTSIDGHGFAVEVNWPVRTNLDFLLAYERFKTDEIFGVSGKQQTITAGMRLFTTEERTRYYFEAAAGTAKAEVTGFGSDDAFTYQLGVGVEFSPSQSTSVSPFLQADFYDDVSDCTLTYGIKASANLGRRWVLTADVAHNDEGDMRYRLGAALRF